MPDRACRVSRGALIGGVVATHALSIAPVLPLAGIATLVPGGALRVCYLGPDPA
ncbi:MAG: hypothetical protein ACREPL_14075 [Rhodanobacteraceae bacterium]